MNFLKNYLLLILMGIGFFIAIIGSSIIGPVISGNQQQQQSNQRQNNQQQQTLDELSELKIEKMDGGIESFKVELALSESEWRYGLMNRDYLPENQGMLFIFPDNEERSFWMKNVVFPLDVVFIDKEGTIHNIITNTNPGDLGSLRSNGPVPYALELNGGISEKLGIEVGDKVVHSKIHAEIHN